LKRIYLAFAIAWRLHAQLPPGHDIRSILEERIDRLHQGVVYRFSSPPGGCFFTWVNGGNRYNPARTGRIPVDAARGNIIRYEEEASGYPAKFGIDWSTMVENWDYVTIGESSWLAPVSAELIVRASDGKMLRMTVEYKNHRHFEASTKITFGKDR